MDEISLLVPPRSEDQAFPSTISKPQIRIRTPTIPEPISHSPPADLQHEIYLELRKLTNTLSANAKAPKSPILQPISPYISRRAGLFPSSQPMAAVQEINDAVVTFEAAEYDALGQQFTTLVIISTFTANLIIAFLTLAHNIISARNTHPKIIFEIGMFLALGGMAVHAGVIIIAGRCAALALKHAKRLTVETQRKQLHERAEDASDECYNESWEATDDDSVRKATPLADRGQGQPKGKETAQQGGSPRAMVKPHLNKIESYDDKEGPPLLDFRRFLKVCEFLQLLGTTVFFLGVTVLIFLIFPHLMFPIMLIVGFVAGSCLLGSLIGFWKISATNQLIEMARGLFQGKKNEKPMKKNGEERNDDVKEKEDRRRKTFIGSQRQRQPDPEIGNEKSA